MYRYLSIYWMKRKIFTIYYTISSMENKDLNSLIVQFIKRRMTHTGQWDDKERFFFLSGCFATLVGCKAALSQWAAAKSDWLIIHKENTKYHVAKLPNVTTTVSHKETFIKVPYNVFKSLNVYDNWVGAVDNAALLWYLIEFCDSHS